LLLGLLNGMIGGHDADRRHARPDDWAALAEGVSRRHQQPLLDERDRNGQLDRWLAVPSMWRCGRTRSSRAVREAVASA
jgi:hypothetical protein